MLEHKFIKFIIEPHKYCMLIHKIPDVIIICTFLTDRKLGYKVTPPCFPCFLTTAGPI